MKRQFAWLGVVPLLLGALAFASPILASPSASTQAATQQAVGNNPLQNIPVTGSIATGGTMRGTLDVVNFTTQNGQVFATGLLDATLYDAGGGVIGSVTNELVQNIPVGFGGQSGPSAPAAACNILHLTLGPLDLNLLGLTVHLDRVVLDITAHSGSGNLLGNLLCAIAHLLDQTPSPLDQIVGLLNRIIDLLG